MKKSILFYLLIFYNLNSFCQSYEEKELDNWIKKNNIVFNSPTTPEGFIHFLNCNEIQAYRKNIGDTIIIYSRGSAIAENIERLDKSINEPEFNVFRYPSYKQSNGTIVVQDLLKWTFLFRRDTLYLLDEEDDRKTEEFIKLMDAYSNEKITESKFNKLSEDIRNKDFGFRPKFKMIYYNGIFNDCHEYIFNKNQNFREEKVTLIKSWKENDKRYFEVNLETNTAGGYIFSDDLIFINTENCKK